MSAAAAALRRFFSPIVRGYGQIFFCPRLAAGALVLAATCLRPALGGPGLLAAIIAAGVARLLGAEPAILETGIVQCNAALAALALALYSPPTPPILALHLALAAATAWLTLTLVRVLGPRRLPALSIAFVLAAWGALAVSVRGLHALWLTAPASWPWAADLDRLLAQTVPGPLVALLQSFGAVVFQPSASVGLVCMLALALRSPRGLAAAAGGGLLGFGIFTLCGMSAAEIPPYNFNCLLIAEALGGVFWAPTGPALAVAAAAVILGAVGGVGAEAILKTLAVTIVPAGAAAPVTVAPLPLAAPFNLITLAALWPAAAGWLNSRSWGLAGPPLAKIQSAETTAAWHRERILLQYAQRTRLTLPFWGPWLVSQGIESWPTHQGDGAFAWDFIVVGPDGASAIDLPIRPAAFRAFGLPVVVPAPGVVVAVENGIADNIPPQDNRSDPWGNFVIIDHGGGEWSEISHFRCGSVKVGPGDRVERGQILGECGNSGRSREPHLHYQLQRGGHSGDESVPAVFADYWILRQAPEYVTTGRPEPGQIVEASKAKVGERDAATDRPIRY